jgi:hypothetical protein
MMMKICFISNTEEDLLQFRFENPGFRGPVRSKDTFLDEQDFLYLAIPTKSIKGYDRYLFDQVILADNSIVIDESILRMVSHSLVPDEFKIQVLRNTSSTEEQIKEMTEKIPNSLHNLLLPTWF